jgi:hypothetical protein
MPNREQAHVSQQSIGWGLSHLGHGHTFLTPSRGYSCLSPPRLLPPPPRLLLPPLRDPRPRLVWNKNSQSIDIHHRPEQKRRVARGKVVVDNREREGSLLTC